MSETNIKKEEMKDTIVKPEIKEDVKPSVVSGNSQKNPNNFSPKGYGQKREFKKNRRDSRHGGRTRSEFEQKILEIRRVTRVAAGGRRFNFSVAIAIGNKNGRIGVGTGKAGDTSFAIQKAVKDAEKNAIDVKMTKNNSIPHQVEAKYNSARVLIIPAKGRGVIAGSALRDLVELGGLGDINGKILSGSKNKLNIARATIKAFLEIGKIVKDDDKNLKIKVKKVGNSFNRRFVKSPRPNRKMTKGRTGFLNNAKSI